MASESEAITLQVPSQEMIQKGSMISSLLRIGLPRTQLGVLHVRFLPLAEYNHWIQHHKEHSISTEHELS